ncbi:MAG TPA: trypsin-like peptidase domain-containing protein [Pyrinomonadaceae bacterium]|nr:trypsin-like peptidase domain-containing protein [Pyrinomonadaceae bacterium]
MKLLISVRQTLLLTVLSAVFSAATVTGIHSLVTDSASAAEETTSSEAISDPAMASDEQNNIEVYRSMAPGVVFITSSRSASGGRGGTGSGSIIDRQGHILTNDHVISGAARINVSLGGTRSYPARVVGRDADTDLAVIKIDAPANELAVVPLGDSNGLIVGQKVLAIGNPFGLDRTLMTGVISGLGRTIRARSGRAIEGVQTDASINPGNSGGPLLNSRGQMIGINSQIYSSNGGSNGVGFAVPVNVAKRILPQLINGGAVVRPRLGVTTRSIASLQGQVRTPVEAGALIVSVAPNSAASLAGLRGITEAADGAVSLGDIITAIDGEAVKSGNDLTKILDRKNVGDTVRIEIVRDGGRQTVAARLTAAN